MIKVSQVYLAAYLACLPVAVLTTSCSSVQSNPAQGVAALRIAVGVGASLALNNNPTYAPAVAALSAGISGAVSSTSTLTPTQITLYVETVCGKYHVKPTDTAVFVGLAVSIYQAYVEAYKPSVVNSADPIVLLYVGAFQNGLNDALSSAKFMPSPAS